MKSIFDIPCPPHKYDIETYNRLSPGDVQFSQMPISERLFVNGLVRYFQPKRILELGVAEGSGSIILLNAISDMLHSKLTSIDISEECYWNSSGRIGHAAQRKHGQNPQWTLIAGKEPSEVMDEIGADGKFDFVVLDTAHFHPGESLNFLTFFPYLADDAVVIVQDIGLYAVNLDPVKSHYNLPLHSFPRIQFAGKLLFDTIVGNKIRLLASDYSNDDWNIIYPNIGAIQINEDTKKYIGDVFSMLEFPWGIIPTKLKSISDFVYRHYDKELYEQLLDAFNKNSVLSFSRFTTYSIKFDYKLYKKIVFYGCGAFLRSMWWRRFVTPNEIWDINAESIKLNVEKYNFLFIEGIPVKTPDFDSCDDKTNTAVIITLAGDTNNQTVDEIISKLHGNGFPTVLHYKDCF